MCVSDRPISRLGLSERRFVPFAAESPARRELILRRLRKRKKTSRRSKPRQSSSSENGATRRSHLRLGVSLKKQTATILRFRRASTAPYRRARDKGGEISISRRGGSKATFSLGGTSEASRPSRAGSLVSCTLHPPVSTVVSQPPRNSISKHAAGTSLCATFRALAWSEITSSRASICHPRPPFGPLLAACITS